MTNFLLRLFVKDHKNTSDPTVRKSYGSVAGIVGIVVNFILAAIKMIAGILSASVAITADALNNLSDAGASVITVFSFKISAKPADKGHPFGHARMEYIASMVVSFLILLVGIEMIMDSVQIILGVKEAAATDVSLLTIIILTSSLLLKLWLAIFYHSVGSRISSGVLRAAATDSLSDCISTVAVLASSIIIKFTSWYIIDAIVGVAVSVVIILAGARILIETKNSLLGEAPVDETVVAIKSIVAKYSDVIGMHDLMVHNYGPTHFIASFHAEVDGKNDIYKLHDMIDNLEKEIKEQLGILCTVHMDPVVTDDETVNQLRALLETALQDCQLEVSVHDFRVVVGETHTNLIFDIVLPFECKISEHDAVDIIEKSVKNLKANCFCVITVDRG